MNQGEIRVMTEDLLDWAFDKGERVRGNVLQSQLDGANTKLREVQSA